MSKCSFTLIRYCHEPTRGEFVNIGLIFKSDEKKLIIPKFSTARIQRIGRLYPDVDESLIKMVKKAIEKAIEPLEAEEQEKKSSPYLGSELELDSKRIRLLDQGYLEYLSSYHNGTIQFTKPQPVVTENPEKEAQRIYKMFVADAEELSTKSEKELSNTVYQRLRRELKPVGNRLDFDYELKRESIQGLMKGTTLDFIGFNGQLVCGKSVDPETQGIEAAYQNLAILIQVFDALRMNFERGSKKGIYYVVTKRPEPSQKKLNHLWTNLMYWSQKNGLQVTDIEGAYQIKQYVEDQRVLPFSEYVKKNK